jgi:hypothetical protein
MRLLKALVLGVVALFLLGLLRGVPPGELYLIPAWYTLGVLGSAAVMLLLGEALMWKRQVFPNFGKSGAISATAGAISETDLTVSATGIALSEIPAEPLISRGKLMETLGTMVRLHYDNRSISRNSMVATGLATQPYWNLAQAILVKLGIRVEGQPSAWNGGADSTADLKLLASRVQVTATEIHVLTAAGWELVDLAQAHYL